MDEMQNRKFEAYKAIARAKVDPLTITNAQQLHDLEEQHAEWARAMMTVEQTPSIQHNTTNNINNSQVIQDSPGAIQNVTIGNGDSMETIKQLIPLLTEWATTAKLNATLAADLNSHIQTLNGQISASKPNRTILKEGLKEVWELVKGIATPLIVEKLKVLLGLTNG